MFQEKVTNIVLLQIIAFSKIVLYNTTRKQKIYEGGFPRDFVVKAVLRGISEKIRFVVIRLS